MRVRLECDDSFSRPVVNLFNIFPGRKALVDETKEFFLCLIAGFPKDM